MVAKNKKQEKTEIVETTITINNKPIHVYEQEVFFKGHDGNFQPIFKGYRGTRRSKLSGFYDKNQESGPCISLSEEVNAMNAKLKEQHEQELAARAPKKDRSYWGSVDGYPEHILVHMVKALGAFVEFAKTTNFSISEFISWAQEGYKDHRFSMWVGRKVLIELSKKQVVQLTQSGEPYDFKHVGSKRSPIMVEFDPEAVKEVPEVTEVPDTGISSPPPQTDADAQTSLVADPNHTPSEEEIETVEEFKAWAQEEYEKEVKESQRKVRLANLEKGRAAKKEKALLKKVNEELDEELGAEEQVVLDDEMAEYVKEHYQDVEEVLLMKMEEILVNVKAKLIQEIKEEIKGDMEIEIISTTEKSSVSPKVDQFDLEEVLSFMDLHEVTRFHYSFKDGDKEITITVD